MSEITASAGARRLNSNTAARTDWTRKKQGVAEYLPTGGT
jgi:hypothetical protein